MAVEREVLGSESHTLIERDMFADDTGLSDDDACAVVDAEVFTDLCAGMDIDACVGVGEFGDYARNNRYAELQQRVGHAVVDHSVDDWVTEDNFSEILYGRIIVEHCLDIGEQHALYFGQRVDEVDCHF